MITTPAGSLLPGDVLIDGTLIIKLEELRATTQHFKVLDRHGKVSIETYDFRFNVSRHPREGEEHTNIATSYNPRAHT
jgi:hypothetical protein